jgi:hypothetical protein
MKLLLNLSPFDHEGNLPNPFIGIDCIFLMRTDASCKPKINKLFSWTRLLAF